MSGKIPFLDLKSTHLEIEAELNEAQRRVIHSGRYILGPEVSAFEAEFADYCGARHCVGMANGLEALQFTLLAWGIGPGDEVLVPSNGYIATWLAVTHTGATPIPVEPDERTFNLDPAQIQRAMNPRVRAVLPIHLYGQPADIEAIRDVVGPGVRILEDAAQGHGARYKGRPVGALGDAAGFSFYPTKNLGALGDGGAVTTNDRALADKLRLLRNYGSAVRFSNEIPGYNSRLDELQAAFLRVRLKHLEDWNERRRKVAAVYAEWLPRVFPDWTLPFVPAWAEPNWHLYVVKTGDRLSAQKQLDALGIGHDLHYPVPPLRQAAYAAHPAAPENYPLAEKLGGLVLSLAMGPSLKAPLLEEKLSRALQRG